MTPHIQINIFMKALDQLSSSSVVLMNILNKAWKHFKTRWALGITFYIRSPVFMISVTRRDRLDIIVNSHQ